MLSIETRITSAGNQQRLQTVSHRHRVRVCAEECVDWGNCLRERGCCATPGCEQWISYVYVSLFLCQEQNQYNFESITSITVVKQEARGAAVVSTYSCWMTFPATQDKPLVVLTYGKYVGWITQSQLVIRAPATLSATRVQLHNNTDI